jgi:hypothetical protein
MVTVTVATMTVAMTAVMIVAMIAVMIVATVDTMTATAVMTTMTTVTAAATRIAILVVKIVVVDGTNNKTPADPGVEELASSGPHCVQRLEWKCHPTWPRARLTHGVGSIR